MLENKGIRNLCIMFGLFEEVPRHRVDIAMESAETTQAWEKFFPTKSMVRFKSTIQKARVFAGSKSFMAISDKKTTETYKYLGR